MLAALVLGWAVIYADRTCLYPLLSVIAQEIGLTSTQAGALTSAYFLLYVIMQIPAGVIGDLVGRKKVLLVMIFISALGLFGLGTLGISYPLLLLFVALHGFGAGGYYTSAYGTMFQVVEPGRRGISSSIIGVGMAFGLLAGLAFSGLVYEAMNSFRAPFILMSLPTFALVMLFYLKIPNTSGGVQAGWEQYRNILLDKQIWLINLATFTALYGFWVAVSWGPTFLQVERSFSMVQAGLFTGLTALTAVPAGLFWGRLSDRVGRKRVALMIMPFAAVSLCLLSLVKSAAGVIGVFLVYGLFANSAFCPVMIAWVADIVNLRYPGCMGAAAGLHNSAIMTSAVIAPVVSGYLSDLTGSLQPAILAGSAIILAGMGLVLLVPEKGKQGLKDEKLRERG
ncbi:MAG: MFS transporter [Peptococcaceae bacterium]|jgi:MFS family permease|nr:MFS transporter [Peptococcaceae bacterium]MDH7525440.1 MFS transporter [Peptococcaceae bacterium]